MLKPIAPTSLIAIESQDVKQPNHHRVKQWEFCCCCLNTKKKLHISLVWNCVTFTYRHYLLKTSWYAHSQKSSHLPWCVHRKGILCITSRQVQFELPLHWDFGWSSSSRPVTPTFGWSSSSRQATLTLGWSSVQVLGPGNWKLCWHTVADQHSVGGADPYGSSHQDLLMAVAAGAKSHSTLHCQTHRQMRKMTLCRGLKTHGVYGAPITGVFLHLPRLPSSARAPTLTCCSLQPA